MQINSPVPTNAQEAINKEIRFWGGGLVKCNWFEGVESSGNVRWNWTHLSWISDAASAAPVGEVSGASHVICLCLLVCLFCQWCSCRTPGPSSRREIGSSGTWRRGWLSWKLRSGWVHVTAARIWINQLKARSSFFHFFNKEFVFIFVFSFCLQNREMHDHMEYFLAGQEPPPLTPTEKPEVVYRWVVISQFTVLLILFLKITC